MRTVGQILKDARITQGFSLEQVERVTKIRRKFLEALEADDYLKFPALPYIQGFVKNYSDFLGLGSHTILALFRRQYAKKDKVRREIIEEPLTQSGWRLTPNKVMLFTVTTLVLVLAGYFYSQYRQLHAPPLLFLENPKADVTVNEKVIAIFGKTDPDATLTINKDPVLVKTDGKFYKDIDLNPGNNTIVVEVTSRVGEKNTVVRKITRVTN